jgi:hypothetical protein
MNGWSWYWLIWAFGGFLGPELYALYTNSGNTLSWQAWRLEDLNPAHPFDMAMWTDVHWTVALLVWLLFLWLALHIPFGLLK